MKFLIWIAIVVAVFWFIRSSKKKASASASRQAESNAKTPADRLTEPMLQCCECGIYLPASEAVTAAGGNVFCSEEHRLSHTAQ
jgi:uncharacterized protein